MPPRRPLTTLLTTLIAFVAVVSLLVSTVQAPPMLHGLAAIVADKQQQQQQQHRDQLRIEPKVTHIDRALAPSLDITKTQARAHERSSKGDDDDDTTERIGAIATNIDPARNADHVDHRISAATRWVSIERPTRARARLMVFLN